jgi:hypothetical protein
MIHTSDEGTLETLDMTNIFETRVLTMVWPASPWRQARRRLRT